MATLTTNYQLKKPAATDAVSISDINGNMDIIEIGLRPGEKMYEEILLEVSEHTKTDNDKIYVEKREAIKPIEEEIKFISQAFDMEENEDIKKLLGEVITTYHEPKIVNN